jgi:hypothetical protein
MIDLGTRALMFPTVRGPEVDPAAAIAEVTANRETE